jgi:hypothetical protein
MADEKTTLMARYNLAWAVLEHPDATPDDRAAANATLDEVTPKLEAILDKEMQDDRAR